MLPAREIGRKKHRCVRTCNQALSVVVQKLPKRCGFKGVGPLKCMRIDMLSAPTDEALRTKLNIKHIVW